MNILGIETSCDETAASVVRDGRDVLSNVIYSQVARHAPYGGVVPEVAARAHVAVLPGIIQRAMDEAGLNWADIDGVAATRGPGLATSLVIGLTAAKSLALRLEVPLLGINHLEAHLYSVLLGPSVPPSASVLPSLVLLVSGGHTCLVRLDGAGRHALLGRTVDDAAGEALDKGAKLLGLGYPGGPVLEAAAVGGRPDFVRFPRGDTRNERRDLTVAHPDLCFSFSGLKTALLYYLKSHPDVLEGKAGLHDLPGRAARPAVAPYLGESLPPSSTSDLFAHVAASYQEAVVDTLVMQVERALDDVAVKSLACAGGVARNASLRARLAAVAEQRGLPLLLAEPDYCTDNAAMIAALGGALLASGATPTPFDVDIDPNLPLT